jgi:plastocyanin
MYESLSSLGRRPHLILLALVVGAALALVACGGDSSSSSNSAATDTPAPTVPAGAPFIDMDSLAYKPNKLTVKSGETVYFKNSETALHTVTVNGDNKSGPMRKGAEFTLVAGAAGRYQITCDYHPQMNAVLTVQ